MWIRLLCNTLHRAAYMYIIVLQNKIDTAFDVHEHKSLQFRLIFHLYGLVQIYFKDEISHKYIYQLMHLSEIIFDDINFALNIKPYIYKLYNYTIYASREAMTIYTSLNHIIRFKGIYRKF